MYLNKDLNYHAKMGCATSTRFNFNKYTLNENGWEYTIETCIY